MQTNKIETINTTTSVLAKALYGDREERKTIQGTLQILWSSMVSLNYTTIIGL